MQTWAIFKDAYRELNHRKLFWIVLGISLAVVIALGLPTNTEKGISVFGASVDFPLLSTKAVSPAGFYKFLLFWIGNNLWLTWGATILALISTASIIPDLVTGGSIDLTLSRPIGRMRLFLTKYVSGLLFVALQTLVFAVAAILLLGLRAGSWELKPLLAVPIVVVFYSYIYSVCALVGLVTRSTLAALLATLFVWMGIYGVTTVENVLLDQRMQRERDLTRVQTQIEGVERSIQEISGQLQSLEMADPDTVPNDPKAAAAPETIAAEVQPGTEPAADGVNDQPRGPHGRRGNRGVRGLLSAGQDLLDAAKATGDPAKLQARRTALDRQLERLKSELPEADENAASMRKWHQRLFVAAAILPKTGETKRLFQRYVVNKDDQEGFLKLLAEQGDDPGANRLLEDALNKRSLTWIVGTSLAFEAFILGIACWIFCRRDF